MNCRATRIGMLALAVTAFTADSAMATRVSISNHSKAQVKKACTGAFWPTSAGGTYGCMNDDGSGIVCGGVKAVHKRTC